MFYCVSLFIFYLVKSSENEYVVAKFFKSVCVKHDSIPMFPSPHFV